MKVNVNVNVSASGRAERRGGMTHSIDANGCSQREPECGAAILIVLVAIVVLVPPTLVLTSLAFRWQRQAIDFRDVVAAEEVARAGFEKSLQRLSGDELNLAPGQASVFVSELPDGIRASVRIERQQDIVLTLSGRVLSGIESGRVDLQRMGVDQEGRAVYQYRQLEVYLVRSEVRRRPTLPVVRVLGVVAELPDDGGLEVLGVDVRRVYDDRERPEQPIRLGSSSSGKAEP
jgi:hypothetical protein